VAARLLILFIRFYRAAVSPLLPPACRYTPTCSEYALLAVERFGAVRGGWLAVRRLLRCHPLGGFGPDPVPPAEPEGAVPPAAEKGHA
jgi:putative membrane protein insertion efficiency factor